MNLGTLKQIYRSPDLRRRVLTVLGLLVIFRFLAHVPVPVPDNAALANFLKTVFASNKVLGFADVFTGRRVGQLLHHHDGRWAIH